MSHLRRRSENNVSKVSQNLRGRIVCEGPVAFKNVSFAKALGVIEPGRFAVAKRRRYILYYLTFLRRTRHVMPPGVKR